MGETISYGSGKVPRETSRWLVEDCMAWRDQRIKKLEAEVERLRSVQENAKVLARLVEQLTDEVARENERWQRVWEAMEAKLEQAPLQKEPLEFWGGYRAALLDIRDFATRERGAKGEVRGGVRWLQQALKESQAENEQLRKACEACADVVGLITDASAERHAMKKLKEAGFGDY